MVGGFLGTASDTEKGTKVELQCRLYASKRVSHDSFHYYIVLIVIRGS